MDRIPRRKFVCAAGALLVAPSVAFGQVQKARRRIGVLAPWIEGHAARQISKGAFPRDLAELGWEAGKNVVIEYRLPTSSVAEMQGLADELVRLRVELIVAVTTEAIMPASRATRQIPIVMWFATHPVENGWVKSLAHPGGNVTGAMWADPEQASKTFELLREAAPRAVRVAVTFNPTYPFGQTWLDGYDRAAAAFGMKLQYFPITRAEEIDPALERVAADRPDALFVSAEAVQIAHAHKFVDFAIARKLIMVSNVGELVEQGALLCHEADRRAIVRRVASYVDRILRGAKPADLPVELPTRFRVIVNAKTAGAIAYKFPHPCLPVPTA